MTTMKAVEVCSDQGPARTEAGFRSQVIDRPRVSIQGQRLHCCRGGAKAEARHQRSHYGGSRPALVSHPLSSAMPIASSPRWTETTPRLQSS
jgi:hypothetical protein